MGGGSSSSSSSSSTSTQQIDERIGASDQAVVFSTKGGDAGISVYNTSDNAFAFAEHTLGTALGTITSGLDIVLQTVNKSSEASAEASKVATQALASTKQELGTGGTTLQTVAKWAAVGAIGYGMVRSFKK